MILDSGILSNYYTTIMLHLQLWNFYNSIILKTRIAAHLSFFMPGCPSVAIRCNPGAIWVPKHGNNGHSGQNLTCTPKTVPS